MGVRILTGKEAGTDKEMAALFDSTSGTAFGPVFSCYEEADAFVDWCDEDPRVLDNRIVDGFRALVRAVDDFRCEFCDDENVFLDDVFDQWQDDRRYRRDREAEEVRGDYERDEHKDRQMEEERDARN